jgi:hypothetical protein
MTMAWKKLVLALVAAAAVVVVALPRAEAAFLVINHGEHAFETGDVPEDLEGEFPDDARAGYKCSVFGIFWAYFTIYDCEPVVFWDEGAGFGFNADKRVVKLLEKEYSEDDMQIPFWAHHGRWIVGAGLLGLVGLGVLRRRK